MAAALVNLVQVQLGRIGVSRRVISSEAKVRRLRENVDARG